MNLIVGCIEKGFGELPDFFKKQISCGRFSSLGKYFNHHGTDTHGIDIFRLQFCQGIHESPGRRGKGLVL